MVQRNETIRACQYCGSTHELVDIILIKNVRLSFERGLEAEHTGQKQLMCNACFMEKIWNTPRTQQDSP